MDDEGITITDPNYRVPVDERMEQELKRHEAENLRRAEEKEAQMLEASWQRSLKRAERRKKFMNGIKKIFARKSNEMSNSGNQIQR